MEFSLASKLGFKIKGPVLVITQWDELLADASAHLCPLLNSIQGLTAFEEQVSSSLHPFFWSMFIPRDHDQTLGVSYSPTSASNDSLLNPGAQCL